jgi:hypothetical protein
MGSESIDRARLIDSDPVDPPSYLAVIDVMLSACRSAVAVCSTVVLLVSGCARGSGQPSAADTTDAHYAAAPAPPARPAYRAIDVPHGGSVTGTITLAHDVPTDTVVQMIADQDVCGQHMRIRLVDHRGDKLVNVVVWLADVHVGKALPIDRRFDISSEECGLDPRVQAVIAGGTLNVFNGDRAVHRTRFLRAGTDSVIALVHETDAGQVVPVRSVLAEPGLVEVRCDMHPYTHGWIRVFDHPYFDLTDRRGRFSLDSVPPGTYHLVAWQPRLGTIERTITVSPGEATKIDLAF